MGIGNPIERSAGMKSLPQIATETGTDKGPSCHDYCHVYEHLLGHLRNEPVRFMEYGLLTGQSAEMWSRWFTHPKAELHFFDIVDWGYRPTDPRISVHLSNASMTNPTLESGNWDVIVDDASHLCSDQIDAFTVSWGHVKPGGFYIIEDLHSVHSAQLTDMPMNIIGYLARIAEHMQDQRGEHGRAAYDPQNPRADIKSIELRRGLAIIRKRP